MHEATGVGLRPHEAISLMFLTIGHYPDPP